MDEIVQCWSNPRIKYFKIRHWNTTSRWRRSQIVHWINQLHFFDPLHGFRRKLWTSTYLGLEPYLPASKGCWCRELVKMEIRNLQSLVGPIILWKSSITKDDWISGSRSGLASLILNWWLILTLLRRWWVNRFFSSGTADKVLKKTRLDFRTKYHACSKYLAAHGCGRAFPENWMRWERHRLTCNVGMSTEYWFSILKILRIIQKMISFCNSCILPVSSSIVYWSSTTAWFQSTT